MKAVAIMIYVQIENNLTFFSSFLHTYAKVR